MYLCVILKDLRFSPSVKNLHLKGLIPDGWQDPLKVTIPSCRFCNCIRIFTDMKKVLEFIPFLWKVLNFLCFLENNLFPIPFLEFGNFSPPSWTFTLNLYCIFWLLVLLWDSVMRKEWGFLTLMKIMSWPNMSRSDPSYSTKMFPVAALKNGTIDSPW